MPPRAPGDALTADALALAIVDAEGRCLFVDACFEQLFVRAPGESTRPAERELQGAIRDVVFSEAARAHFADGKTFSAIVDLAGQSGAGGLVALSITPVRDGAGQLPARAIVIRRPDTRASEREELRQSEARYAAMFDNPAIKILLDPVTGRIEDANGAAARFYGYSREQLCQMRITDINTLHEGEVKEEMRRAADEGRDYFRFRHRLASGEVRRVEVFTGPLRFGERTRLLSILHDVTDVEIALERLRESELRLRGLLHALPVGVAVHRGGRYLYVNDTLAALLGRSDTELVGASILDTYPPQDHPEVQGRVESVMAGTSSRISRRRLVKKDGTIVSVDACGIPFELEGAPAALVVFLDVSERERLEMQLRRAQRMDAVGRLAGGVAHDFNNMLLVILGSVEFLGRRPQGENAVHLERIGEAATRAAELTRQLLYFSKGSEPGDARVDVSAAVGDTLRMLGSSLGPAIEVELQLASGATAAIDPTSLDQLLVNLAVNARDAMPDGGVLRVRTELVEIGPESRSRHPELAAGRYVRLVVADTGTGMTEEVRAHAFEPFFTTKEPARGTGLGLSVTYGIVQRAQGAIEIESELGRGATFIVWLPLAAPRAVEPAIRAAAPRAAAERTVLVTEDHDGVRRVVHRILADAGYTVLAAASPTEALAMLAAHAGPIHLLLSDVIMPRMSGPELARLVRSARPEIRVLFMTGFSGEAPDLEGKVLLKPFGEDELLAAVAGEIGDLAPEQVGPA